MNDTNLLQFLPFSRKPLAKGLAAIFSCVIWGHTSRVKAPVAWIGYCHLLKQGHSPVGSGRLSRR